jgi:hypothetical protein
MQFTIRRMMVVVAVVGAACWTWRQFQLSRLYESQGYHEMVCFAITIVSASVLRWPGAWVGARLGMMAHHALGWFTAAIASAIAILLLNFADESDHFLDDLRGGLAASAILGGMFFATIVEIVTCILECLWPAPPGVKAFYLDVLHREIEGGTRRDERQG